MPLLTEKKILPRNENNLTSYENPKFDLELIAYLISSSKGWMHLFYLNYKNFLLINTPSST